MLKVLCMVLAFQALVKSVESVTRPSPTGIHHSIKDTCIFIAGFLALEIESACLDSSGHQRVTNQRTEHHLSPEPFEKGVPVTGWSENGCVTVPARPGITTQEELFCSYTDTEFAHGRGISVITTPDHAKSLRQMPAFVDPEVIADVNVESNPPYYTQQIPNKGMGVIVNRTLHRGDLIFRYTPVFMLHRRILETMDAETRREMQRSSIASLPAPTAKLFMSLLGHFGGDHVDDVIWTNSFQTDVGLVDDQLHNIVLPETSRMNHDCRPSATYFFDQKLMAHSVFATRTIHAGEELSISYTDYKEPRASRRAAITESWGFPCSCSLCTQPDFLIEQSDKRLRLITEIETEMMDWTPQSSASTTKADLLVALYEQERLNAYMGTAYVHAALTYSAFKHKDMALKYAALAVDHVLIENGADALDSVEMVSLLANPEAHWSWGRRG